MRRLLLLALFGAALALWSAEFLFRRPGIAEKALESRAPSARHIPSPTPPVRRAQICSRPLGIHVGQVDSGFEIDRVRFIDAVKAAAAEWRDATGREWFRYREDGEITVNLLFDGRQEGLDREKEARTRVAAKLASLKDRRASNDTAKDELRSEIADWELMERGLERRIDLYQRRIQQLVESGEADEGEFAAIERERETLISEYQAIEERRQRFLAANDASKAERQEITQDASALVADIDELKRKFPVRAFIEGQHIQGGPINEIAIYTYQSPEELHFALLHEMGHAIGLGHSAARGAVMNPLRMVGVGDFHLGSADVQAALKLCNKS